MNNEILIVEDEKPMARALELKLTSAGFNTVVVYDGEAALTALKKGNFGLVLLDLVLPKKDGFAVLEELKKTGSKIPVLVLSNLGQQEDLKRAKDLGALGYFIKADTSLATIVEQVKKALAV